MLFFSTHEYLINVIFCLNHRSLFHYPMCIIFCCGVVILILQARKYSFYILQCSISPNPMLSINRKDLNFFLVILHFKFATEENWNKVIFTKHYNLSISKHFLFILKEWHCLHSRISSVIKVRCGYLVINFAK